MKKIYAMAFVLAAMTVPAFAQEKAAEAKKVEAKPEATVVEKRLNIRGNLLQRDGDSQIGQRISSRLGNRGNFLSNLRARRS